MTRIRLITGTLREQATLSSQSCPPGIIAVMKRHAGTVPAEPQPRLTRNRAVQRRRQMLAVGAPPPKPRPEVSPARKRRPTSRRRAHLHATDLQDLASKKWSAHGPAGIDPVLPSMQETQVRILLRRPVAPLPRTPRFFARFGPPMTAEDLRQDAPSVFKESRRLIEDVLERRKATQSAPGYIAPDTPFWRVPQKLRKNKGVKWQEEATPGSSDPVADDPFGEAAPVDSAEAAERLQGIVDLKRAPKHWQTDPLSPSKLASKVLADEWSSGATSAPGGALPAEPRVAGAADAGHQAGGATARRRGPAESLVAELRARAQEFEASGVNPDIKDSLEQALRHHPGTERAERLREMHACDKSFEELVMENKASRENCNELIRAQCLQGRMDLAMQTHDAMKLHGYDPDAETFVSLLVGAAKLRDAPLARRLFLKMREQLISATPKIYATLIKAHVRAGDLASGFSLLRKMEDESVKPDVVVYTVLIDGLVNAGKFDKAWDEFHSARTWKLIQPDEVLFTIMIKACARAEEPERALNMLDDLRMCGLYPTDITYGEIIHAMSTTEHHARKAFDFLRQMQAEDLPLNPFIFEKLLQACKSLGDVKRAREIVKEIRNHDIDLNPSMYYQLVGLFASAMHGGRVAEHERLRNLRCAWHVVAEARRRCPRLNWTRLLNEVMGVYIAGGFSQFAVDTLQQYPLFGASPNAATYRQLLVMLGTDLKDVGRFFALWEVVPRDPPPADELFNLALDVAMQTRSAKRTCEVLEEMCDLRVFPTPQLAERLAKAGRNVVQIHHLVGKLVALNKEEKVNTVHRETALLQASMDERELELAAIGRTSESPTPEQEVRARHFEKLHKRGYFKRPWLPLGEYIASKQKGGEAYARRHDKPRPNLLAS